MKAVQIDGYGKISDVLVREVPVPVPAPGQVLVRVRAAAVNPLDLLDLSGAVKLIQDYAMPLTLGNEFVGTVEKPGDGVSGFAPGDLVYARLPIRSIGAFAEYVAVDEDALAPVPAGLGVEEAAVIPLAGLTAWQALTEELKAEPGQTVLVTGGSGGLGQLLVPIAKELGLKVIVTGNADSRERLIALGADRYFDYRTENYAEALRSSPVDHVIDTLGEAEFSRALSVLKPGGRLLGLRGAPNAEFARRFGMPPFKRALFALSGARLDRMARKQGKEYRFMFVRADGGQLRRVGDIVEQRKLHPVVDSHRFGLDEAREALEFVATGHPEGKVIIRLG